MDLIEAQSFDEWLEEAYTRHVDKEGKVTRRKDRKTRSRRANVTTGRSKADRKRAARKAARTKKQNPASQKKAQKQRKRTLKKRKARLGSKA